MATYKNLVQGLLALCMLVGGMTIEAADGNAGAPQDGPAAVKAAGPVIMTVNGEPVTQGELDEQIEMIMGRMQAQGMDPTQTTDTAQMEAMMGEMAKKQLVDSKLLEQAIEKELPQIKDADVTAEIAKINKSLEQEGTTLEDVLKERGETVDTVKTDIKKSLAAVKVVEREVGSIEPKPEEIKKFMEEHKADIDKQNEQKPAEERRTSHILLGFKSGDPRDPNFKPDPAERDALKKKAEEVLARVKKGEDFAKLAGELSSCPSSKQGGDLGFNERGRMVPAYDEAAFKLKEGEISDVVETQFGFHVIKLTGIKTRQPNKIDEEQIKQMLRQRSMRSNLQLALINLNKTAKINDLTSTGTTTFKMPAHPPINNAPAPGAAQ